MATLRTALTTMGADSMGSPVWGGELRGRRRGRGLRGLLGLGVRVAEHASRELLLVHARDEIALTIVFDRDSK